MNPHVDEVIMSDYVASELRIVLFNIKKGLWRLTDDALDRVRHSVEKEIW